MQCIFEVAFGLCGRSAAQTLGMILSMITWGTVRPICRAGAMVEMAMSTLTWVSALPVGPGRWVTVILSERPWPGPISVAPITQLKVTASNLS